MLESMTQDKCLLKYTNLNRLKQNISDDEDNSQDEEFEEQVKISLMDLRFSLGSHIDRELNSREYI